MSKLRVAIYLRVSTQDQSCELQRSEALRFIQLKGYKLYKIYEDTASGTNGKRPQFSDLMRDSHQKKFDVIICWKLDRFFRSMKDLVNVLNDLSERNIAFVSIKESIDMGTPAGRLLTHLLAAFAEFEADIIRERVIAGLNNARLKGKRLGRPPSVSASQILHFRNKGMSLREIGLALNVSKSAVSKTLKKLRIKGELEQKSKSSCAVS